MQLTGHKNVESVNEYGSASFQQQMNMSNILSSVAFPIKALAPSLPYMFIVTLEIEAFANIENLPFGMFESLTFTLPS
jgi:hypothetical protein